MVAEDGEPDGLKVRLSVGAELDVMLGAGVVVASSTSKLRRE